MRAQPGNKITLTDPSGNRIGRAVLGASLGFFEVFEIQERQVDEDQPTAPFLAVRPNGPWAWCFGPSEKERKAWEGENGG